MKAVPFRTVDRLLIHLKLREKFWILNLISCLGCLALLALSLSGALPSHWIWIGFAVWCLLVCSLGYVVRSFIAGAMYTNYQALKQLSDGDLTTRLNFFLVRDEFSQIALVIDKIAQREQELVQNSQSTIELLTQLQQQLQQQAPQYQM